MVTNFLLITEWILESISKNQRNISSGHGALGLTMPTIEKMPFIFTAVRESLLILDYGRKGCIR